MLNQTLKLFVIWIALAIATNTSARAEDAPTAPAAPESVQAAAPPETAAPASLAAPEATPALAANASLDDRIQSVKGDVIELNRDLMVLEEELLFPASTQVAVFLSMDVGKLFSLDSVQVKLDDNVVANYLYAPGEVQALHRGGVQRLYLGNLRAGEHELVALFVGSGPYARDYRRGATLSFKKGTEPKYIELQIKDNTDKLQPEFEVKTWQ
jgi:hypothetical protein